jgi:hypothetical protein
LPPAHRLEIEDANRFPVRACRNAALMVGEFARSVREPIGVNSQAFGGRQLSGALVNRMNVANGSQPPVWRPGLPVAKQTSYDYAPGSRPGVMALAENYLACPIE